MAWKPTRSLSETDSLLCAPGNIHEIETRAIDGRLLRVYKNLWPSLRAFWLDSVSKYSDKTYIVFEEQRWSYNQVHKEAITAAALFRNVYGIRKGDRVGICSKNCAEFLVIFWACQLLGAVSVAVNAWLPIDPLMFCLTHTQCRLIIVDAERAEKLEPALPSLSEDMHVTAFLVLNSFEGKGRWAGMTCYETAKKTAGDVRSILDQDPGISPEDNAAIMFTSGTTGLPKGALSTQRQMLTNVPNSVFASRRAVLRRGGDLVHGLQEVQKGALVAVPLFHVTGLTSYSLMSTYLGMKIILMRKWMPEEAATLIKRENIDVAGGVPAMVFDIIRSSLVGYPLETLFFGGSPAPDTLPVKALEAFPSASLSQGYGMTETNSIAVGIAGDDYKTRPQSTGLPSPVNEVVIMDGEIVVPAGKVGEVWLRGPNVMKGYWRDPDATMKAVTKDGWMKTGDLGMLDADGFLYIKDRIKDIIIRGGENIDSVSVENALYSDPRVAEAAAVGVPDNRLGELVAAVVYIKPEFQGLVTEAALISVCQKRLPKYAVPVMILIEDKPFGLTPSGKIMKMDLRNLARRKWIAVGAQPVVSL